MQDIGLRNRLNRSIVYEKRCKYAQRLLNGFLPVLEPTDIWKDKLLSTYKTRSGKAYPYESHWFINAAARGPGDARGG